MLRESMKTSRQKLMDGVQKTGGLFSDSLKSLFAEDPKQDEDVDGMLPGSEYDKTRYLVNHEKSTSKDFMDELTQSVPVKDLYQVIKVCASHQGCDYQALLLQIVNDDLMKMYNSATHLVQVRNMRGELVFQRTLTMPPEAEMPEEVDPIHCWYICQTHFIYMLSSSMHAKDCQWIYVIDLRTTNNNPILKEIRVKNHFEQEMGIFDKVGIFQQSELIIAGQTQLRHLDLTKFLRGVNPDVVRGHVYTLNLPVQNFGLLHFYELNVKVTYPTIDMSAFRISQGSELREMLNLGNHSLGLVFENVQNQLEFYQIKSNQVQGISLLQLQDATKRQGGTRKKWSPGDEITMQSNSLYWEEKLKKYMHCGIALRKSGSLDFYYNFRHVEETDPTLEKATQELNHSQESSYRADKNAAVFSNIYADFGQLYFTDSISIFSCDMSWQESIGLMTSAKLSMENNLDKNRSLRRAWSNIIKKRVSGSARLFSSFMLFFTKMLVAHHNIVSIYDCISGRWSEPARTTSMNEFDPNLSTDAVKNKSHHFAFEAPVQQIFRAKMDQETGAYEIGVLLRNQTVRCLVGMETSSSDIKIELSGSYIRLPGHIQHMCFDSEMKENGKSLFMLIDKSKRYSKEIDRANTTMAMRQRRQTFVKQATFGNEIEEGRRFSTLSDQSLGALKLNKTNSSSGEALLRQQRQSILGTIKEGNSKLKKLINKQENSSYSQSSSSEKEDDSDNSSGEERGEIIIHSDSDSDVESKTGPQITIESQQDDIQSQKSNIPDSLKQLLKLGMKKNLTRPRDSFSSSNSIINLMSQGLSKQVSRTAKMMNKKIGDRGFFNLRKTNGGVRAMLSSQKDNLLGGETPDHPVQLYVIIQGQLSKVRGMPDLPKGTTICLEYNCQIDQSQKPVTLIYIDNLDRRLLAAFKLTEIGKSNRISYNSTFVTKNLAYGLTKRQQEGGHKASHREIQAVLGPQIDSTFITEEQRNNIGKNEKNKYRRLVITNGDFCQYGDDGTEIDSYISGRNVRNAIQVDRLWTYTISDKRDSWNNEKKKSDDTKVMQSGLYLYDYQRMQRTGDVEVYKIRDAIGGVNSHIDFSYFMQRICFVADLDYIEIVPVANRNVINFFGMKPRDDYMIWHHDKQSGTFTAVDHSGLLTKWSTTTGLISEYPEKSAKKGKVVVPKVFDFQGKELRAATKEKRYFDTKKMKPAYQIFKGDQNDLTYFKGWQNRGKSTIQLLVHKDPIQKFFFKKDLEAKKTGTLGAQITKLFRAKLTKELENLGKTFEYRKFLLIQLRESPNPKTNEWIETLLEFEHVYYPSFIEPDTSGVCQRLYFNEDITKMLERRKDSVCFIYELDKEKSKGKAENGAQKVSWKIWRSVQRFPSMLSGVTSYPFLFSPNFQFYIDVDYEGDSFVVRDVSKNGSVEHVIPSGLMSLSLKGSTKSKKSLPRLAKLLGFYDNKNLRIVDKGGIESIYNFRRGAIQYRLVCSASIDNFVTNNFKFNHYLYDRAVQNPAHTLERLVMIMDKTKVLQQIYRRMIHNRETDGVNERLERKIVENIYGNLFSIDFDAKSDEKDATSFITCELSFTFLDFQIAERVLYERSFNLQNIDEQSRIQQCFNIYPGITTVQHKLASSDFTNFDADATTKLYTAAQNLNLEPELQKKYILPMLEDIQWRTPLDMLFDPATFNLNLAAQFLWNMKDYPFMHSGHIINRIIPKALEMGVPDIDIFLDHRIRASTHLESHWLTKQALKHESRKIVKGYYYDTTMAEPWEDKNLIVDTLFDKNLFKKNLQLKYFDLPELHLNTKIGQEFWNALGTSPDTEYFDKMVIQILINFKWETFKPRILKNFVAPYLSYILMFTLWSNMFYANRYKDGYFTGNLIMCAIMIIMSFYFFYVETYQMRLQGCSYFTSFWNYLDIIPLVLMVTIAVWCAEDAISVRFKLVAGENYEEAQLRDYFQSVNAILMWFKFAYFLRVTDQTGWLIRMIGEVVSDLLPFLLVMLISLLAFTDAFMSIAQSQKATSEGDGNPDPESSMIVTNFFDALLYSYYIPIGQYDVSKFTGHAKYMAWLYFMMASFFNLIIMLNLLISIISDTFTRIMEVKEQLSFQTKATLIAKYLYLDDRSGNLHGAQRDRMLIIAMETEKQGEEPSANRVDIVDIMEELKLMKEKQFADESELKAQMKAMQPDELELSDYSDMSDDQK